MSDLLGNVASLVQSALAGLSMRENVVAQNIANANTPGYQAQDVQFTASLNEALATGSVDPTVVSAPGAATNDGNTVSLEAQLGLMNEIATQQEGLMQVLQSDYTSVHTINQDLSSPGV